MKTLTLDQVEAALTDNVIRAAVDEWLQSSGSSRDCVGARRLLMDRFAAVASQDEASVARLAAELEVMSRRGIWAGEPPLGEERYEEGFKSAMAHCAQELARCIRHRVESQVDGGGQ